MAIADQIAKPAITEKIYQYCRAVDRLDVSLGHSVFHPDSQAIFGSYKGTGRGWIDFICQQHRCYLHHSHQVTNICIEVLDSLAGSESYVTASLLSNEDGKKKLLRQFWARYIDRWSYREGHWAIDKRECVVDFATICPVETIEVGGRARRDLGDPSYAVLSGALGDELGSPIGHSHA